MLFTEFNMEDALEVRYEEGVEDGELLKLIQLVCRKLQKGLSSEAIASDLEEEPQLIQKICEAISQSGPNAATNEIYRIFQTLK